MSPKSIQTVVSGPIILPPIFKEDTGALYPSNTRVVEAPVLLNLRKLLEGLKSYIQEIKEQGECPSETTQYHS